MILDAAGAIFWPQQNLLIVADLHLEKDSYSASRGNPLPGYDTRDTLERLEQLILHYQPKKLICLGDNLHDLSAIDRMLEEDYAYLCDLNKRTEWLWIIGNHDRASIEHPLLKRFIFQYTQQINLILLSHDLHISTTPQIIGHFHPKATIRIRSHTITGKCFLVDPKILIMPAFSSYMGGLDIKSTVFEKIIDKNHTK